MSLLQGPTALSTRPYIKLLTLYARVKYYFINFKCRPNVLIILQCLNFICAGLPLINIEGPNIVLLYQIYRF